MDDLITLGITAQFIAAVFIGAVLGSGAALVFCWWFS